MQKTFAVLNTSGHAISGYGLTLSPGLNTGVSAAAFQRAFFGADGKPTPAAAKHLVSSGDKPPALLPVATRAIPQLSQDYALQAVAMATVSDARTLQALLEVEQRKPVLEAIHAKLAAFSATEADSPAAPVAEPQPAATQEALLTPEAAPQSQPSPSRRSRRGQE